MNRKEQNSTGMYGETMTRKNLKPLYVSLEDMIPDYSELIEQNENTQSEKTT